MPKGTKLDTTNFDAAIAFAESNNVALTYGAQKYGIDKNQLYNYRAAKKRTGRFPGTDTTIEYINANTTPTTTRTTTTPKAQLIVLMGAPEDVIVALTHLKASNT